MKYLITKVAGETKVEPFESKPKGPYNYDYQKTKPKHLCFGCANGYPSKCPKVFDRENKLLSDNTFVFIEDGFQVVKIENGIKEIESFVVSSCTKYVKTKDNNNAKDNITSRRKRTLKR